jgi:hypothetical protein
VAAVNKIEIFAYSQEWRMKLDILEARDRICGVAPRPRPIAQTMDDLPVPLGPIIKFRPGDGEIVIFSNVIKLRNLIVWMEPSAKL